MKTLGSQIKDFLHMEWENVLPHMWQKFRANHCLGLAAELGFWFLYSVFPFLIFLVSLSSFLPFSNDPENVLKTLHGYLPAPAFNLIAPTVRNVLIGTSGWLAGGTFLLALWAASTAVSSLIGTLNRVYEVEETRPFWKVKGLALLLTITLVIAYLLVFTLLVLGPVFSALLVAIVGEGSTLHTLFKTLRFATVLLSMIAAFSLIYSYAPNIRGKHKAVLPGAVTAMIGWFGISWGFGFYVENFANYNRFYGTLGAVIAVMTWLYLVGLMILIGGLVNSEIKRFLPQSTGKGKDPSGKA